MQHISQKDDPIEKERCRRNLRLAVVPVPYLAFLQPDTDSETRTHNYFTEKRVVGVIKLSSTNNSREGKETNSPHAPFLLMSTSGTYTDYDTATRPLFPRVLALQSGPINISPWIAKFPTASGVCFLPPAAILL